MDENRTDSEWWLLAVPLGRFVHIHQCNFSLPGVRRRLNQTIIECADGSCEQHEQNVWALFPRCPSDSRAEGISTASAQRLQGNCK